MGLGWVFRQGHPHNVGDHPHYAGDQREGDAEKGPPKGKAWWLGRSSVSRLSKYLRAVTAYVTDVEKKPRPLTVASSSSDAWG